ncbi:D-2-hydroxyacid dehydrogenase [Lewinella sp. IMCC34183]|uniref:D-2-hydroxyacid dehydrogenase n=1 Tax=Lewinella sp. IMCC34183 TaxID=2248762 RepID=UPI000E22DA93|nr:D-2-hydroxyacid dehydrogenase [Lewinella sp. IMCC34183]
MKLYIDLSLSAADAAYLRQRVTADELIFGQELPEDEREAAARRAEVIMGGPPVAWLRNNTVLRWLHLSSAGFNAYVGLADAEPAFTVTNSAGLFGTPVAETAVAGVLALLRGIPKFVELKDRRKWRGAEVRPELGKLSGRYAILLGHGSIGGTLATMLAGFGCRVETMGRTGDATFHTNEELDVRLPKADLVVATLPETDETINLFDARRLELLSPDCIFVNVGRGSLVDEAALLQLLHAGRIGGAVLDVTRAEPLADDDPLWSAPRTLLTQHSAGGAADEKRVLVDGFLDNLARYRDGKPLAHVVDLDRGY